MLPMLFDGELDEDIIANLIETANKLDYNPEEDEDCYEDYDDNDYYEDYDDNDYYEEDE